MGLNNKDRVLSIFFENPERKFTVRKLASLTRIPRSTIQRLLESMRREKLIDKKNRFLDNSYTKIKKINYFTEKIVLSGLVDFLIEELNPSCIFVFGSIAKGDSVKDSDLDLFVETSINKKLDLSRFERKIRHKIDLFIESDVKNLQPNLLNNVVNGIKFFGNFKIK